MNSKRTTGRLRSVLLIGLFAAVMAVCAWISVPAPIPFTLQTLAVFLASSLLGGRRALAALAVYVMLGLIGLPVFSRFGAGLGVILGPTGGFILGFFFAVLISSLVVSRFGKRPVFMFIGHTLGLLALYAFGTAWYVLGYQSGQQMGVWAALSACVFPFIIPDMLKISLAILIDRRVERAIRA
jgi:biotin transport system substrate-specific component